MNVVRNWDFCFVLQGDDVYDAILNQTNVRDNNNKFFVLQVLGESSLTLNNNFLVAWLFWLLFKINMTILVLFEYRKPLEAAFDDSLSFFLVPNAIIIDLYYPLCIVQSRIVKRHTWFTPDGEELV